MAKFVSGKDLEELVYDIIFHAKKKLLLVSPYIKLDDYFKSLFEKHLVNIDLSITIVFGKNEDQKTRSLNRKDLEYFAKFPNITILYIPTLHGKYYASESKSVVTSINLYDYSFLNNIEFGVSFETNLLSQITKSGTEQEALQHCQQLVAKADVIFASRPILQSKLIGKNYRGSEILVDYTNDVIRNKNYESIKINTLPSFVKYSETQPIDRPSREQLEKPPKKSSFRLGKKPQMQKSTNNQKGYCIRTGEEIKYNPKYPLSFDAYKVWSEYENIDYPEEYCHRTGKRSYGKTSFRYPILNDKHENKFRSNVLR